VKTVSGTMLTLQVSAERQASSFLPLSLIWTHQADGVGGVTLRAPGCPPASTDGSTGAAFLTASFGGYLQPLMDSFKPATFLGLINSLFKGTVCAGTVRRTLNLCFRRQSDEIQSIPH